VKNVTRREFIVGSAATAAAGVCMCGLGGCSTITKIGNTPQITSGAYSIEEASVKLALDKVPQLANIGGSGKIIDPALPDSLIIARTGEAQYIATSIKCTHRGVEIEYHHDSGHFKCASLGGSKFELDGTNISGPAKEPLKAYPTSLEEGRLVIHIPA